MKALPRILWMVNWRERGAWNLYRTLKQTFSVDVIQPYGFGFWSAGRPWTMSVYWSEFYLPLMAIALSGRYDCVLSWSMRLGVNFGILKAMLKKKHPKHIFYDFHLNLARKSLFYRWKKLLCHRALRGTDHVLTTSTREELLYSAMFRLNRKKITFFPIAAPMECLNSSPYNVKDYVFSYGNSDRDYDTLINAFRGLPYRLYILTQSYQPPQNLPENVHVLKKKRVGKDLMDLIGAARLVVIPLQQGDVAAGQTAMLESMAMGRPVIITENFATVEYAKHGETAFFCPPRDQECLRRLIRNLWQDSIYAERVGQAARRAVMPLSQRQVDLLSQILLSL